MRHILLCGLILANTKFASAILRITQTNGSLVTAPNAGLVLVHQGQYRPPHEVVHSTIMFPMTTSTCYLLPVAAARKIPACQQLTTNIRQRRLIGDIISIGVSVTAFGTATASIVLTKNLEKRVNQFEANLQAMASRVEIGDARAARFEANSIRLGTILQNSQNLLNATIERVNEHSTAIQAHENRLNEYDRRIIMLQQLVANNEEATNNRFLYIAIREIMDDKPTLSFLHPSDMHSVAKGILQDNNITIPDEVETLPIIELISKLIIRQQVDFIPASHYTNSSDREIGKLTITTFYALPDQLRSDFEVYKVVVAPFIHHNKILRLAQMPVYIGISQKQNSSITWHAEDLQSCVFHLMTTCRITPAERAYGHGNDCLEQILTGNALRRCRTEQSKATLPYIQQLQKDRWLISTNNTSLHCIQAPTRDTTTTKTTIWNENVLITIPPMAIVTVQNGTTIHCPEFNLPGSVTPDKRATINIIKNLSTYEENKEIIDLHKEISSNETWEKLPYVNEEMNLFIHDMMSQTTQKNTPDDTLPWHKRHSGKLLSGCSIAIGISMVISIGLVWYVKQSVGSKITIALPKAIV